MPNDRFSFDKILKESNNQINDVSNNIEDEDLELIKNKIKNNQKEKIQTNKNFEIDINNIPEIGLLKEKNTVETEELPKFEELTPNIDNSEVKNSLPEDDNINDDVNDQEIEEIIQKGIDYQLIIQDGNYYKLSSSDIAKFGIKRFINYLKDNPDIYTKLINDIDSINKTNIDCKEEENHSVVNKTQIDESNTDISNKILEYVCKETVKNLINNFKSDIYTEKFTKDLFNEYINNKIDSSNPLFKELISECINKDVKDNYLKDLTKDVLKYIGKV